MSGPFGKAPLTSDIGLFLEIGVLITLLVGRYFFARKGRIAAHGYAVTVAIAMHTASVLSIMIPSFAKSADILFTDLLNPPVILTWIHIPLGVAVIVLGIYLIAEWQFRPPGATCYRRVKLMKPLWLLWILSLIMGFLIYLSIAIY